MISIYLLPDLKRRMRLYPMAVALFLINFLCYFLRLFK